MKIRHIFFIVFFVNIFTLWIGCSDDNKSGPAGSANSCVGCHTNYEKLKAIASPDTALEGGEGGCGGDAPHIEPYDRVYMGGAGFTAFKNSTHGGLECTFCHNGTDDTGDKTLAHSGNFIRHPSDFAADKCASCHADIVNRTSNSLHANGWGQKSMVTLRSGAASFEALSAQMKAGYDKNCGKCHAGCGDCHVTRPTAGGGGLYKGHQFAQHPNMQDNCTACHTSRIGHAFYGIASGTIPDVHLSASGFTCVSCHTKNEIHGDGVAYDQRYKMALKPSCTGCHSNIASSNTYHLMHMNTFNCQTCHSQDYNNCGSCHIGGEGARIPSYQGFKIARNPIPDTKPYPLATVRRSLMAPDSWSLYGTATLVNFDIRPTYKYTTPHNIKRWTSRTQVASGKPCYDNCHIIKEGEVFRNKELYLFNSDLTQSWEINANQNIIVDGHLPTGWGLSKNVPTNIKEK